MADNRGNIWALLQVISSPGNWDCVKPKRNDLQVVHLSERILSAVAGRAFYTYNQGITKYRHFSAEAQQEPIFRSCSSRSPRDLETGGDPPFLCGDPVLPV